MTVQAEEVARGERFQFGRNWRQFLQLLDEERIAAAEASILKMTGLQRLDGKSFLDAGSGSGLFSLAARRLGASVHSFDYDPESVSCAAELKRRFFPDDSNWTIEQASVLDTEYLESLGKSDIVYSWGVVHHTGAMWQALENVRSLVVDGGRLCLSIYNDQGGASNRWRMIKRMYNRSPQPIKMAILLKVGLFIEMRSALIRLVRFQNPLPFRDWAQKKKDRGMSAWFDLVDWVGGYPFEVAKPEAIFNFYRERGFTLVGMTTQAGGYGCNEFVFEKTSTDVS